MTTLIVGSKNAPNVFLDTSRGLRRSLLGSPSAGNSYGAVGENCKICLLSWRISSVDVSPPHKSSLPSFRASSSSAVYFSWPASCGHSSTSKCSWMIV
jgi:hypothetical protein